MTSGSLSRPVFFLPSAVSDEQEPGTRKADILNEQQCVHTHVVYCLYKVKEMQSCLALFLTALDNSNAGVHFTFLFLVVLDLQLLINAKLDHCSHID